MNPLFPEFRRSCCQSYFISCLIRIGIPSSVTMRELMLAPERMEVKEKGEVVKIRDLLIELPIRNHSAIANHVASKRGHDG